MSLDRTMYKLLLVSLTVFALTQAFGMVGILAANAGYMWMPSWTRTVFSVASTLYPISQFLLALMALYWVPRLVRQLIPEVR